MERLKMFVVQEPVVAASCLIAGVGTLSRSLIYPKIKFRAFLCAKLPSFSPIPSIIAGHICSADGN